MKTKEELNALKEEVVTLNKKLAELTEEELLQVTGGMTNWIDCTFSGNTGTSGGAVLTSNLQDKPVQEGGQACDFRPMSPATSSHAYHPFIQPTEPEGVKFYNQSKK